MDIYSLLRPACPPLLGTKGIWFLGAKSMQGCWMWVEMRVHFLQLSGAVSGVRPHPSQPCPFNPPSAGGFAVLFPIGSHISSRYLKAPGYLALEPVVPNGSLCKSRLFPGEC